MPSTTSNSPSKSSKNHSSNSKPPSSSSSTKSASVKKLGTLSSFQATLHFNQASSSSSEKTNGTFPSSSYNKPSFTLTKSLAFSSSSSSSRSQVREDTDKQAMPPPPNSTTTAPNQIIHSNDTGKGKGKGKEKVNSDEVIEVDSDDEIMEIAQLLSKKRRINEKNESSSSSTLWADEYAPEEESELAPGKARIMKLKRWLQEAIYGGEAVMSQSSKDRIRKYRRILIVHGPAGVGKTTTVRLIAKEMGVELVEWTEGVEDYSLGSGFDRESAISKLSSFLLRNSYPSLSSSSSTSACTTRALLLTSLPNLSHLPTRDQFHTALFEFAKSFTSSSSPLIIVHSDLGSGGSAELSWMDNERGRREGVVEVLGKNLRDGPWCQSIEFLPLAPTFLVKALNRILDRAAVDEKKRPAPSVIQLIALSANGDLRSAINSLQLLCTKSLMTGDENNKRKRGGSAKASGKGSRGGKGARLDVSSELRAVLDVVTRREHSLNLFHALGKVLYNKRLGDPPNDNDDQEEINAVNQLPLSDPLPDHLKEFIRAPSMVQMETFIPIIPVDASSFTLWIHQNLPNFCNEIEDVSWALESFCYADIMKTDDDIWQSSPQTIAYALHLTIRGALMTLPSPVTRRSQKLIKPHFFEAFRTERDSRTLLDTAAGYLAKKSAMHTDYAWGGVPSQTVLATEVVPMAMKIQSPSNPILPLSVQPLMMPPYSKQAFEGPELDERGDGGVDEEAFEEDEVESGVSRQGWAIDGGELNEGDGDEEEWMKEDIQEWD